MQLLKRICFNYLSDDYWTRLLLKSFTDSILLIFSYILTYRILNISMHEHFYGELCGIVIVSLIIAFGKKFYSHLWRFTSLYNILPVLVHCVSVTALLSLWLYFGDEKRESLVNFCFLFMVLSFVSLNFIRVLTRFVFEGSGRQSSRGDKVRVIIIGANKGCELFIRESRKHTDVIYETIGILDDNSSLWGTKLFGIPIHGAIDELAKMVANFKIQMVVVATTSLTKEKLSNITQTANKIGVNVCTLPSFDNLLMSEDYSLKDISMDELLGRDSINFDTQEVSKYIQGKVVLVTGAGGSIGSEMCRQLIRLQPELIILVDHSEYNLYKISWELEHTLKHANFKSVLTSVNDLKEMESVFATYRPQVVFHAAAYKHVPLLEKHVKQAVVNNFFGTKNIAELASKYETERFILISTDKAVNPTNVMGTTKRMAEIFCENYNNFSKTNYITVRFGNVLGSDGSVVPLFKKQLKQGGPLTVTHPEITRFFMSIREASQLVLQAGAIGSGGEIFVLDMGNPIKISDLAERLILMSGKQPYKDIDIVFVGLRPGEKLHEELFHENEHHTATGCKKIFLAKCRPTDFNDFSNNILNLKSLIDESREDLIVEMISKMVPDAKINHTSNAPYGVEKNQDDIAA